MTRPLLNLRRWETYERCQPRDVPEGIIWTETAGSRIAGGRHRVAFGGPSDCAQRHEWGAPFRRIYDRKTRIATFFVYKRSPRCEDKGRPHAFETGADGWPICSRCGSTGL